MAKSGYYILYSRYHPMRPNFRHNKSFIFILFLLLSGGEIIAIVFLRSEENLCSVLAFICDTNIIKINNIYIERDFIKY